MIKHLASAVLLSSLFTLSAFADSAKLVGKYVSKDSKLTLTIEEKVKNANDLFGRNEKIYVGSIEGEIATADWSESISENKFQMELKGQGTNETLVYDVSGGECDDPGCTTIAAFSVEVKDGKASFDYEFFGYAPGEDEEEDARWEKFMEEAGTGTVKFKKIAPSKATAKK